MAKNKIVPLQFSKRLPAYWLTNIENYRLGKKTIVVNLGQGDVVMDTPEPLKPLKPRTSSVFIDGVIRSGDSVVYFDMPDDLTNVGGVILDEGWCQLSAQAPDYPRDIPLYKSPQFTVGKVRFDPFFVSGQSNHEDKSKMEEFEVKVNIWFCPAKTNCGIHNVHTHPEMLEVHTQIYGTGRMQKFKEKDFASIYEDVIMDPGMTHAPFTGVKKNGDLFYGWHQYYSDNDCIWMANEFHPMN